MDYIKIDRYVAEVVPGTERVEYYAEIGKGDKAKRIHMPKAYAKMYTDDYLGIRETELERPEVMGVETPHHHIPVRTRL